MDDPTDSGLWAIESPVAVDLGIPSNLSFSQCEVIQQTHIVHFPFVLPINAAEPAPRGKSEEAVRVKYRIMRLSDVGYTALGFLFGVITDTEIVAECQGMKRSDSSGTPQTAGGKGPVITTPALKFLFASGVADAPLNSDLLKELPSLLEQAKPKRILLLASAGCEGNPEVNQQLMKDRANWAKSALKGLAQGASLEIGYRDANRCTSEDEPRPDDRYVTIVPLK